jgi:uncharacterized protein (DUF58 family)
MSWRKAQASRLNPFQFAHRPYFKFILKRSGPFDSIVLDRRRVYILPTKRGMVFALVLLVLLVGSINYTKSLGFMLTFLLVGIGNVAMFSTWRNLAGLCLRAGTGGSAFAGQNAQFSVQLENKDGSSRRSIALSHENVEHEVVDVPQHGLAQIHFSVPTTSRGVQPAGRFRLYTTFPTGLFVAWTWIELNMSALVYPRPAETAVTPVAAVAHEGDDAYQGAGLEEFSGLRKYQIGDSWRRVSWKTSARSESLYTKEFSGGKPDLVWIDMNTIVAKDVEQALSIMTRLVIDAEAASERYGLRLPTVEIAPDSGKAHYHQCLRALALYGL